ncbi:hypothetical protein EMCRGX_G014861 [Ephydatia muelleri]
MGISLVPGEKLCPLCRTHLQKLSVQAPEELPMVVDVPFPGPGPSISGLNEELPTSMSASTESTSDDSVAHVIDTDEVIQYLNLSPVKLGGLSSTQRLNRAQDKFHKASAVLKGRLEESYQTSFEGLEEPDAKKAKEDADELSLYRHLMESLKDKFHQSKSYQEKLQILTLSPFTIEQTQDFFSTTNYMVKKSRKLREMNGVMSVPQKMTKGRKLIEELKADVAAFYESDEVSRLCPGRKDSVSVRLPSGEKGRKQKRLVLANLKELYSAFKETHPNSKALTLFVCVFTIRTPNSCFSSLTKELDLTECMKAAVCDMASEKCMMQECKSCPGKEGVVNLLSSLEELDLSEDITYRQWMTTDRCTLLTVTESVESFIESLAEKVVLLTRHHHVAQMQTQHLKKLKETNPTSECIIVGDFSENFSFVVQDAAQGYHWENTQATLHPFVVYIRNGDGSLGVDSHCIISDTTQHTTSTVYAFLKTLLEGLKVKYPAIKKVRYFSDGCAGQYKNRFNLINLCFHQEDFGLMAEWNFFATSHGKTACDGIGGTAKRLTLKASLQCPVSNQIINPRDMFSFCSENISGIQFYFVSKEAVLEAEASLEERFRTSRTIKGTQRYHRYIPQSTSTLAGHEISLGERTAVVSVVESLQVDTSDGTKGSYIACMYEEEVWYGLVEEISEEFGDFLIKFMHPSVGGRRSVFLEKDDTCWVRESDILCTIEPPNLTSGRGGYSISEESKSKAEKAHTLWERTLK